MNQNNKTNFHNILMGIFAAIGLAMMLYMTYVFYSSATPFCDISNAISCGAVSESIYSRVLGVPISVLGVIYFSFVLLLLFVGAGPKMLNILFLTTLFVIIPSLYFSFTEFFLIGAFCLLCESSKVMMLGILGVSFGAMKERHKLGSKSILVASLSGLATIITYFLQTAI